MILVDTSAWVAYDRADGTPAHQRLRALIGEDSGVAVTEPVIAEVVAGARDGTREVQLRRLLERFVLLPFESPTDFDGAVRIYRRCRNEGVTPRGLLDCMVTAVALRHDADILAHDADLARIATVVSLPLDEGSLYP